MINKLKKSDWHFVTNWNSRSIYKLGTSRIFEHNGKIGIVSGYDLIYCDLTDEELEEFTRLSKKQEVIYKHLDCHTVKEWRDIMDELKLFTKRMKEKEL